jgi:hypothetical protein
MWRPTSITWPGSASSSVRRSTFFSALIDRTVTPDELRHELLSLIQGWPATVGKQAPAEHLKVIADAAT